MTKRLIVTADDLGLHQGMTDGSIRAHREGIVTACSVSACGRDIDHAVEALRSERELDVGIHFTLVEEKPVLSSERIPTLIDNSGLFPAKWPQFAARYLAGRIRPEEIEAELRAQLQSLLDRGLRISHANSHQHLHLLPSIHEIVVRIASESNIPYVRTVRDRGIRLSFRGAMIATLGLLGRGVSRNSAIRSNDTTLGVTDAGHLDVATLISLLDRIEGLTELVTHPGTGNQEIERVYDWGYDWDAETEALSSPELRRAIERAGVELIRIRDL